MKRREPVIGKELQDPAIVLGNVDNMDETGVLYSVLRSLKVLEEPVLRALLQIKVSQLLATLVVVVDALDGCVQRRATTSFTGMLAS